MMEISAPSLTFTAVVAGQSVRTLFDSGASHSFISQDLVEKLHLRVRNQLPESFHDAKLPDGATIKLVGQATVTLHFGGGLRTNIRCLVAPLIGYDIIIGDEWLVGHKAILDFGSQTISVEVNRKHYVLCDQAVQPVLAKQATIGAVQTLKAVRAGCQLFVVKLEADEIEGCAPPVHDGNALGGDVSHLPGNDVPVVSGASIASVTSLPGTTAPVLPSAADPEMPANVKALLDEYSDVFPDVLPGGLPPDRNIHHVIPTEAGAQAKVPYLPRYSVTELNTSS
jgi:hypothetical protein